MKYTITMLLVVYAWIASAQLLTEIESVEYDPSQNRFFISNTNDIIQRASNGDLSQFGTGSATHGMEVMGGNLFVIDNNVVRAYDLSTEELVMSLEISGVQFLNGMANDGVSKIWVTDFNAEKIHEIDVSDLENPIVLEVVSNTDGKPNGIVYDYLLDRLVYVVWGSNADINEVDTDTYEINNLIQTDYGNLDGIDMTMQGNFYVSSWSPNRIIKYNSEFSTSEELPIIGLNQPADISYADATDTLAIPNSGSDNVLYYSESATFIDNRETEGNDYDLTVVPNPAMGSSELRFKLVNSSNIKVRIYNSEGKIVRTCCDGLFLPGKHAINIDRAGLKSGTYFVHIEFGSRIIQRQLIFE